MTHKRSYMIEKKKEIIRRFISAYNSFDVDTMLALLHPDIHFKNISAGKVNAETNGISEFEKLARQSSALFMERKQKIISYKELSDRINVDIRYQAILAVHLPGGLKIGDTIDMKGKSEYIIKDNLIISIIDES